MEHKLKYYKLPSHTEGADRQSGVRQGAISWSGSPTLTAEHNHVLRLKQLEAAGQIR
ncbi:hypothetical protein NDU88_009032, partial [Pleurodeles waltl]